MISYNQCDIKIYIKLLLSSQFWSTLEYQYKEKKSLHNKFLKEMWSKFIQMRRNNPCYLFLWSWAGRILRILQPGWFREQAVFSYLLTTVMVTKRRVKLRIERAKFQFVLIIFCNRAVLLFNFLIKNSDENYHSDVICWHVDETMWKIKTWLFQFFLEVSPTF